LAIDILWPREKRFWKVVKVKVRIRVIVRGGTGNKPTVANWMLMVTCAVIGQILE